jgi:transposase
MLRLDETISCETPPLYSCSCRIGEQACVPISGHQARRVLHGALNIYSGAVLVLRTEVGNEQTHQYFLPRLRAHWRGRQIVLFADRGTPHPTDDSGEVVREVDIERRWLPRATPELKALDHLWRHVKGRALADRPTRSIDQSAAAACRYVLEMSPGERLQKAGIFSGNCWLTK